MRLLESILRGWRSGSFGWTTAPLQREQVLALCILMVLGGSMLFYLLPQQIYDPRANLWSSLLLFALMPLIWVRHLHFIVANLALLIFVSLVTYIAVKTGGISSPVMVYLMVLAVPTLFFLGVWGAAVWMLLVLSIQVGLLLATLQGGLIQPMQTQGTVLWTLLNHVLACIMMMWMLSLFEHSHRSQLAVVQARNLELEAASAQLMAAQSHKDEFVAAVGHELRTPMNAILGLNGLLREELADNPAHVDTVEHIRHSTEHLLSVVNRILDFAQLQAGRVQLFPEPIALQAWLAALLPRFSARAQAKGLDWHVQVAPQLPAEIWLDRQRLSQLLEHLLDNAIKFTAQGGITLRLQWQNECLRVEVQAGWVDDLVELFNSASVVLYDSADYWRGRGVSEGFGLPPIEALACGCVVFSSLNHALADSLDPGLVGHQLGAGTLGADVDRIMAAIANPQAWHPAPEALEALMDGCSEPVQLARWQRALLEINGHWDRLLAGEPALRAPARWRIQAQQWAARLAKLAR